MQTTGYNLNSGQIFKISTVHLRTYVTNMFLDFPNTFSRPSFPSEETDVTGIRLRIVCTDKAQQSRFPSTVLTTQRPLLTTTDCPVQFFQNSSVAITDTDLIKFYYFLRIVIVAIRWQIYNPLLQIIQSGNHISTAESFQIGFTFHFRKDLHFVHRNDMSDE